MTFEHLDSEATGLTERYVVYETSGAGAADQASLLVLLHGASADETQWLDVGIASTADCLAASDGLGPLVIVLVDGGSVDRDHGGNVPPMERLVTEEVLPAVRLAHPNLAGRDGTSIGGISRGGGWALAIAASRPDLFSSVGGHSPAATIAPAQARALHEGHVRVWLDVGHDDGLADNVADLQVALNRFDVAPMVIRSRGGHDRRYWSLHTEDYLRFYERLW